MSTTDTTTALPPFTMNPTCARCGGRRIHREFHTFPQQGFEGLVGCVRCGPLFQTDHSYLCCVACSYAWRTQGNPAWRHAGKAREEEDTDMTSITGNPGKTCG